MDSPAIVNRRNLWMGVLLVCLTGLAYLPAIRGGFSWDDDTYLTDNGAIRSTNGLYQFWCTTRTVDYWPVTSTTLWVEWRLWGMHAAGYHLTNVALHIVDALLLWAILRRLRVQGAYFAALLFALHPVNVESVAWITQRKNVLAMLFYLLAILGFIRGGDLRPSGWNRWHTGSLLAFGLGMLSKGSIALLPGVLLGVVAWRRPLRMADVRRMTPFFLVAGLFTVVDMASQHHGLTEVIRTAGPVERLLGAGAVVWFYLYKALIPVNLMFIYPMWHIRADEAFWWAPLFGAAAATLVLWRGRRSWSRPLLFGWLYFCAALLPVMGFVDVYFMKYSLVADHYQHLALIAVAVLAAVGLDRGIRWLFPASGGERRIAWGAAGGVLVCTLAVLTWRQCGIYRDVETLYRTTLRQNPGCWVFHNNLGNLLSDAGRYGEAIREYERALQLHPDFPEAHNNLGNALDSVGRLPEAIAQFKEALHLKPDYAGAHSDLGMVLAETGRLPAAIEQYRLALQLRPDYAEGHLNLGVALARTGRIGAAIGECEMALKLKPDFEEAHNNLGFLLARTGRLLGAVGEFEAVLRDRPDSAAAHYSLGLALAGLGNRRADAIKQVREAIRLQPGMSEATAELGRLEAVGP